MVSKERIISEIQRLADLNQGTPLGMNRFETETGIKPKDWSGRYWAKWSDAVLEAGYAPNNKTEKRHSDDELKRRFIDLTLELKHFPTIADRQLKRRSDKSFPTHTVFEIRLGNRQALLNTLIDFIRDNPEYELALEHFLPLVNSTTDPGQSGIDSESPRGHVYLIQTGKWYKIGCTWDILRRHGELRINLPEAKPIHTIETDDPFGVEKYWHRRFDALRVQNEFFNLTSKEIRAFKRWRKIY
jgi:hypothetical protein